MQDVCNGVLLEGCKRVVQDVVRNLRESYVIYLKDVCKIVL